VSWTELQDIEQLRYLVIHLRGMAHRDMRIHRIAVAPTHLRTSHVSGVDKVTDDALSSPLGDADRRSNISKSCVGIAPDAEQHLRMAREEVPPAV
jgi:hypothetical protein